MRRLLCALFGHDVWPSMHPALQGSTRFVCERCGHLDRPVSA